MNLLFSKFCRKQCYELLELVERAHGWVQSPRTGGERDGGRKVGAGTGEWMGK
jgi:hypothetical protein